jgi:hypothetical protein
VQIGYIWLRIRALEPAGYVNCGVILSYVGDYGFKNQVF